MEAARNNFHGLYPPGSQVPQISKRLESVLENYLPIIQEKLPYPELRKQLSPFVSATVIDNKIYPEVYHAICELYKAAIIPETLDKYDHALLDKIIYPSLYSRGILIKHVNPRDFAQIKQKSLYYGGVDSSFVNIVNSSGKQINDRGDVESALVLISTNRESGSLREAYGSIHYTLYSDHCFIHSIQIDNNKMRCKYGTLLIGSAILEAKEKGLNECKLWSVEESLFFYLSLCFLPDEVLELDNYDWWTAASLAAKVHIIEKAELFPLTLIINKNERLLKQRIKNALKFQESDEGVEEEERVVSNILRLPSEAFELGWLSKDDYQDRQDIQIYDSKS